MNPTDEKLAKAMVQEYHDNKYKVLWFAVASFFAIAGALLLIGGTIYFFLNLVSKH
jgi:hypothetical protein